MTIRMSDHAGAESTLVVSGDRFLRVEGDSLFNLDNLTPAERATIALAVLGIEVEVSEGDDLVNLLVDGESLFTYPKGFDAKRLLDYAAVHLQAVITLSGPPDDGLTDDQRAYRDGLEHLLDEFGEYQSDARLRRLIRDFRRGPRRLGPFRPHRGR